MLENETSNSNAEHSLEDVAASLIMRPADKQEEKPPVAKVPEQEIADENSEDEGSDSERTEEETAAETPDESSENEEATDEEDVDVDELEIEVAIDGKEEKVKLKDLKANYSGNKAIEKRLQEATEIRTAAMEQGQKLYAALQEEASRLAKLDEIVKRVAEPEINWEELKRTNLPKYLLERDRQREAQERQKALQAEQARVKAEQEKIEAMAREQYTAQEAKQLVSKIPEFADPVKAQETFTKLAKAASAYGYATEEVSSVLDHRAMLVLHDAMKYQEIMKKQGTVQKKTAPATALLRPGSSNAKPQNSAKKLRDALVKKARTTGRAEDVAATLLIRKK